MILHTLFETVENTQFGMNFINKYITFWPGGKPTADSFINIIGDTVSACGWLSAYLILKLTINIKFIKNKNKNIIKTHITINIIFLLQTLISFFLKIL